MSSTITLLLKTKGSHELSRNSLSPKESWALIISQLTNISLCTCVLSSDLGTKGHMGEKRHSLHHLQGHRVLGQKGFKSPSLALIIQMMTPVWWKRIGRLPLSARNLLNSGERGYG